MLWLKEDIEGYVPRDYEPLKQLYTKMGLPKTDPQRRWKYLSEEVMALSELDLERMEKIALEQGKAKALNMLEDKVIEAHQAQIENVKERIMLPIRDMF